MVRLFSPIGEIRIFDIIFLISLAAEGMRNPFRRYEIAKTRRIIYAA